MTDMDILDEIVAHKRTELESLKREVPYAVLEQKLNAMAGRLHRPVSMRGSLAASSSGIIAEFKRKSPSKGWIHQDARPSDVVPEYAANGASALSILTDEKYFGGSTDYIAAMCERVTLPILRKDFIIDEYQITEARLIGADAVLLIAACLSEEECHRLAAFAKSLQLETLLEVHSEEEIGYVDDNIDMIGVNNRNLGTFHVDVANSFDLAPKLPDRLLKVSESGLKSADTIKRLREAGYRGFLMGETFMRTPDPAAALSQLIADIG